MKTVKDVAVEATKRSKTEYTVKRVGVTLARHKIGSLLTPRMRVIDDADFERAVTIVLSTKTGNPQFGKVDYRSVGEEKTKPPNKSEKKPKKKN